MQRILSVWIEQLIKWDNPRVSFEFFGKVTKNKEIKRKAKDHEQALMGEYKLHQMLEYEKGKETDWEPNPEDIPSLKLNKLPSQQHVLLVYFEFWYKNPRS